MALKTRPDPLRGRCWRDGFALVLMYALFCGPLPPDKKVKIWLACVERTGLLSVARARWGAYPHRVAGAMPACVSSRQAMCEGKIATRLLRAAQFWL